MSFKYVYSLTLKYILNVYMTIWITSAIFFKTKSMYFFDPSDPYDQSDLSDPSNPSDPSDPSDPSSPSNPKCEIAENV